ncbi:NAD-dependent epimerase/dehydratase family protein [Nocardia sp. NPDC056064]|uniref:NAD-dependent epimerase/dehydratase family protein n=1 Tax=Nocardia sp. NPDC056064 TaxID=3345701 RepID=UPI0035D6BA5C
MRTIVTGAAGFIGSNLVDSLLADGHTVVGIDNLATGRIDNLDNAFQHDTFTLAETGVTRSDLGELVGEIAPDVVFHLAAQVDVRKSVGDPCSDAGTNVLGTINVAEACRQAGTRRVVFAASGGSRYGAPTALPIAEDAPPHPLSPYAAAKVAGELYLSAYADMYGLAPISLALSNVYGPRQDPRGEAGVVAIFGCALLRGHPGTIYGDGTATRDYVYVGDVVDAFRSAGAAPETLTGTFNIGTGVQTTTTDLHRMIAAALGVDDPPVYAPARTGEVQAIALDHTAAHQRLGWDPHVGITDGIDHTIAWLRETLDRRDSATPATA